MPPKATKRGRSPAPSPKAAATPRGRSAKASGAKTPRGGAGAATSKSKGRSPVPAAAKRSRASSRTSASPAAAKAKAKAKAKPKAGPKAKATTKAGAGAGNGGAGAGAKAKGKASPTAKGSGKAGASASGKTAALKTFPRPDEDVATFLASVADERQRADLTALDKLVRKLAPHLGAPKMWGTNHKIIGYGDLHYKYASGREGDWMHLGLAANKGASALYVCGDGSGNYLLGKYAERLGKAANCGKGCLRFKRLDDLPRDALEDLIREAAAQTSAR